MKDFGKSKPEEDPEAAELAKFVENMNASFLSARMLLKGANPQAL